jgi:PAS domain S-box-containing protein
MFSTGTFIRSLRTPDGRNSGRAWSVAGLIAVAQALAAMLGHESAIEPGHYVVIWMPSGILLGAVLLTPRRQWPAILALGWLVAVAVKVFWRKQTWEVGCLFGLATVCEVVIAAALTRAWAGPDAKFVCVREFSRMILVSLAVATPVGAAIGATTAAHLIDRSFWADWKTWWLGDALGIVVVTPAILLWAARRLLLRHWTVRTKSELIGSFALALAAAVAIYGRPNQDALTQSLLLPVYALVVARLGALGLAVGLAVVVPLACFYTKQGLGPLAHLGTPIEKATMLQWTLLAQAFTGWLVAILWAHLRISLEEQRAANNQLESKVAERTVALESNSRRLHIALAAGSGFVFEWDIVRDEVRRYTTPENPVGQTIPPTAVRFAQVVEAVLPEDRATFEQRIRDALRSPSNAYTNEYRVQRPDGSITHLIDSGRIERDLTGLPIRLIGLAQDVSEQRRAEAERLVQLQRLQAVLQTRDLIVFNQDAQLRYTWVHNIAEGFDPTAVIGRGDDELFSQPEDIETLTRIKRHTLESGKPGREEVTIEVMGTVRTYDLMVQPQRDARGVIVGITCACVDVTERRAAAEALRKNEERLRIAAQTAGFGVHDYDILADRVIWSPELYSILGVPPDRMLTLKDATSCTHPSDRERVTAAMTRAMDPAGDGGFAEEFRVLRADTGELRWVFNRARTTFDGAGATRRAVRNNGVIFDITERKRAEERLANSERRFRSIVDQAAIGVVQADGDGRIVLANQRACQLFGYTEAEILGCSLEALTLPEDWPASAAALRRLIQGGSDFSLEKRYRRKDGTLLWASSTVNALRDRTGHFLGLVAMVLDISARKHVEENLRAAEERMQLAMFAGNAATWDMDLTTGRNVWSESHFRLLGLEPPPDRVAVEAQWRSAILPEDLPQVLDSLERSRQDCGEFRSEHRMRRFDNAAVIWVRAAGRFWCDPSGKPVRFVGVFFDITAERHAAQALRESERTLRSFYESSPYMMGVVEVPPEGDEILHVYDSPATERFFGLAVGATAGRWAGVDLRISQPRRELWVKNYRESQRRGSSVQFEYSERFSGVERWFSAVVAYIGPAGSRSRFSYLVEDVTERKRAESALRDAQESLEQHADALEGMVAERTARLQQAVQQMEEFSYTVAHDLRAPLRAMGTYARILDEDFGQRLDESGRDYLRRIAEAGNRMDRLIRDLLAYSHVARAPVTSERVSLERLAIEARQQYRASSDSPAEITIEQPLLEVNGHDALLAQVLGNLIGNAVKFVRPKTVVLINIRTERRGSRVRLWVEDNGIGVAPEQQARIWGMFERGHPKSGYEGTGVGLALVRKAVERMSGEAGVESDGATGSRFWIELPAADPS